MRSNPTHAYSHSSTSDGATSLRVINLIDVPRGGFHFDVVETKVRIQASSIHRLKSLVLDHFHANRLDVPPNFEETIETVACRNLGAHAGHWCSDSAGGLLYPPGQQTRSRWTSADVLRFARTVKEWGLKTGFSFVDEAEAARRAAICAACPKNIHVRGCLGCSGVEALVTSIKGSRSTPDDKRLETCDVCGCYLKAKVWLPTDALGDDRLEYPPNCWQSTSDPVVESSTSESPEQTEHHP